MKTWAATALCLGLCASCGGRAVQSSADAGSVGVAFTPDAGVGGSGMTPGSDAGVAPVCEPRPIPKEHRASAVCPSERGTVMTPDISNCSNRSQIACTRDADCTVGKNGRCFRIDTCETACSYDECLADSDCPSGPCGCRSSASDPAANGCVPGGNCRTDADCGCYSCSPSTVVGLFCGEESFTYQCHTANDECTDASDCSNAPCAYIAEQGRWECQICMHYRS